MDWSLVLNNPESLNCYSISGRARERDPETPEKYQEGTTSCCLSGFLVNLCRRTVALVSPCEPGEADPFGYHQWDAAEFRDAGELEQVLEKMQKEFFLQGPEELARLRLSPEWNFTISGGRAEFVSRYLVRRFEVSPSEQNLLEKLKAGISRQEFEQEFGGMLSLFGNVHALLDSLWKFGMLSEEEAC